MNPTDYSMDISGISQAHMYNNGSQRLNQQIKAQNSAGTIGKTVKGKKKPPRVAQKQMSGIQYHNDQSMSQDPEMKALNYIEESREYARVISNLNTLLVQPRQHMPLKASSTSDISYLSHRNPQRQLTYSPNHTHRNKDYSPPQKISPRMAKKVKGQLLVNQKRAFNPQAVISIGPKKRQNQTIMHERARASIEPAFDSMSRLSHNSPKSNMQTAVGQIKRKSVPHATLEYPHSRVHYQDRPSQSSMSIRSVGRMTTNQSRLQSHNTSAMGTGNQFNSHNRNNITAAVSQRSIRSQNSCLSKQEQLRKYHFDRSLQREVEAIERVISHKQDQPHHPGPLKTQKQIDVYVDSLKQQGYNNSIVNIEPVLNDRLGPSDKSRLSSSPVLKTATLSRQDRSDEIQVVTVGSSARQIYEDDRRQHLQESDQLVSSQNETEKKTQSLLRQIQELQPMVMQVKQCNKEEAKQIQDLMELHHDIRGLQDSQSQQTQSMGNYLQPEDRMTVHEMLPNQMIPMGYSYKSSVINSDIGMQ